MSIFILLNSLSGGIDCGVDPVDDGVDPVDAHPIIVKMLRITIKELMPNLILPMIFLLVEIGNFEKLVCPTGYFSCSV